jgi:predicted ATPase
MKPSPRLYVITGAPGTGKTAILSNIGAGVRCVPEPARGILAQQRSVGGDGIPDRDPSLFVDLLLQRSIENHDAALREPEPVLFDRGVPDCIAYASHLGTDPSRSVHASEVYRYHPEILLLQPWEGIYAVDEERTMSFADTLGFHEAVVAAYKRAGYVLVDVPPGSVQSRVAFVRGFMRDQER